jgi:low temperature requirement protein LtrA
MDALLERVVYKEHEYYGRLTMVSGMSSILSGVCIFMWYIMSFGMAFWGVALAIEWLNPI